MAFFKQQEVASKDIIKYRYSGISEEDLKDLLQELFMKAGYQERGTVNNRLVLEKGNYTQRILFGAFVKYFKFMLLLEKDQEDIVVSLFRATSGMSGGIIGKDQVTGEVIRLGKLMKSI